MTTNTKPQVNQVKIKVNGAYIQEELMVELLDIEVSTTLYLPSMFVMRFHDDDLKWMDQDDLKVGLSVSIELYGLYTTNAWGTVITGEITAIEPEFNENFTALLVVRGYDKSHRMNRETKTKVFVNVTDSDIVSQIVGAYGLSAQSEATSQVHEHVFQHNQTDLEFLHQRALRNGYEVVIDDTTLYFRKPAGGRGTLTLGWGDTLRSFRPRLSAAGQVQQVSVKGWDPKNKQAIVGQATSSSISPQIGLGKWGGSLAQEAFGAAPRLEVRQSVATQAEADKLAQSLLDQVNSAFIDAEGVAYGNPTLVAGIKVTLENLSTRFSGTYLVTSAVHYFSRDGYDTYFTVEGARPQLMSDLVSEPTPNDNADLHRQWGGVVPALVTNNNDPDNMCRVKVKFPWLDDQLESNWARVSAIGAGASRGLLWIPEVNDEVLVAFEHGDFNRPYVIGSLWNGSDAMPETTSTAVKNGAVVMRTFKTRAGHVIRLVDDDSGKYIEIVDSTSQTSIKMDETNKKITITSKGDVAVDATGNVNLTAQGNVSVKATSNIELEATSNVSIKGTGNVSVEATGNLTLKGAMVNIN